MHCTQAAQCTAGGGEWVLSILNGEDSAQASAQEGSDLFNLKWRKSEKDPSAQYWKTEEGWVHWNGIVSECRCCT